MQPTYFPWAGYFHLIDRVDVFVFLDDVQYERSRTTWQKRNRVLLDGKTHWLAVPAIRGSLEQAINDVTLDDASDWRRKHFTLLSQAYARHPFTREMLAAAERILDASLTHLAELNMTIITDLCRALGFTTKFERSSQTKVGGHRTERLIGLCELFGCDEYVSPPGSAAYLAEDGFAQRTSIRLSFNDFSPAPYPQMGVAEFVSHLSVLDVIANLGCRATADYVRNGRPADPPSLRSGD